MPILFFDTETTGKAVDKAPAEDPRQPNLVQLGAVLTDDNLNEMAAIDLVVFPVAWTIPKDAAEIHGINQGTAETYGVSLIAALLPFIEMLEAADRVVAHNAEYDVLVIQKAYSMLFGTPERDRRGAALGLVKGADPFEGKEIRCTMRVAKKLLKLPNRNPYINDPYKFPRLEECIKHFFEEEFEGAHNALYDVRGTIRVYREICRLTGSPH